MLLPVTKVLVMVFPSVADHTASNTTSVNLGLSHITSIFCWAFVPDASRFCPFQQAAPDRAPGLVAFCMRRRQPITQQVLTAH
jgi:hypothetical protein